MDHADHYFRAGRDFQKEEIVKKGIAFFDFDGTITTKDTLLQFIKFTEGSFRFYLGFFLRIHYLVAYKIKLVSNQVAKEKILEFFFKNRPVFEFNEKCTVFAQNVLPGLIRPKALEEIRKLKNRDIVVVVVSASPENWIKDWAAMQGVELIASRLETSGGKLTGRILGKNCHGPEKVRRIQDKYEMTEYTEIYAYGDTSGDKDMLKLAHNSFYKPFRH